MGRFVETNPDWNVTVWDDGDMDGIIRRGAQEGIISREEYELLVSNGTGGARRLTPWRVRVSSWIGLWLFVCLVSRLGRKTRALG